MASQTQVRVDLRSTSLSSSAELSELPDGSFFIALDEPPPVRTVLSVREADDELRTFEILHVVEIGEAGPTGNRGCQGRFVEAERLEQQHGVGSEHLAAGESHSSPVAAGSDDGVSEEIESVPPEVQVPPDAASTSEATEVPQEEPPAEVVQTLESETSAAAASAATVQDQPSSAETNEPTSGRAAVTSSGGKNRKSRKRR